MSTPQVMTNDEDLLEINGAMVHRNYVVVSAIYTVLVLCLWPFTIVGCRRAYLKYINSKSKDMTHPIYWGHVAANTTLLTIVAIDPVSIFFDVSGTVNIVCLLEGTLILQSSAIATFVESLRHYMVEQTLTEPPWIKAFKKQFFWFNIGVGNLMLIIQIAVDRTFLSGLTLIFLAIEGAIVGPVFCVVVVRLTSRLIDQFRASAAVELGNGERREAILKGVRKFRLFAFLSTALMYFLVVIVAAVYIPRMLGDKTLVASNDPGSPDFARHRRFKQTFKLNWIMWVMLNTSCYITWRHWIKKARMDKHSSDTGNTSTTHESSGYTPKASANKAAVHPDTPGSTYAPIALASPDRRYTRDFDESKDNAPTPTNIVVAQNV